MFCIVLLSWIPAKRLFFLGYILLSWIPYYAKVSISASKFLVVLEV